MSKAGQDRNRIYIGSAEAAFPSGVSLFDHSDLTGVELNQNARPPLSAAVVRRDTLLGQVKIGRYPGTLEHSG
jgi:hypothetical protein